MRVAVAAIGRSTFDLDLAREQVGVAVGVLDGLDAEIVVEPGLCLDDTASEMAAERLRATSPDAVVVLLGTFTDATLAAPFRAVTDGPLVLWAFPEPRTGGRLRLNSLCGLNLAAYALPGEVRGTYTAPDADDALNIVTSLLARADLRPEPSGSAGVGVPTGPVVGQTVGVIGDAPAGFDPCTYDDGELAALLGVTVERRELPELFARATAADGSSVVASWSTLGGIDDVDPAAVGRSAGLHVALEQMVSEEGWSGLATRCWPECFTDYGSAACAAQGRLADAGIPATCEADVYGTLTALLLQAVLPAPAFVADLVHLDSETSTGVMWHCGVAPPSLADPETRPRATVHSNRRQPLLHEFALRPGAVTLARLSRGPSGHRLLVGRGEMVRAPIAFSGTSGVVRLERSVDDLVRLMVDERLDHHYGLAYGDGVAALEAIADEAGIPVVHL